MRYRLMYHIYDYTSDEDPGTSSYQEFYVRDDKAALKRVAYIVKYTHDVECGIMSPLKLLKITQRKTKKQEEQSIEIHLREPRAIHLETVSIPTKNPAN